MTYALKSDDPTYYMGKLPNSATAVIGFVEYPQVRESRRLDQALKQIEGQFGLTPAARTRLRVPAEEGKPDDGKARIFRPSAN